MAVRRFFAILTTFAVAILGLLFVAPVTANAEPPYVCGEGWPVVAGAKAHWQAWCSHSGIEVRGWVQDTRADNLCAYAYGYSHKGQRQWSPNACGKGVQKNFTFEFPGIECCTFSIEIWTRAP